MFGNSQRIIDSLNSIQSDLHTVKSDVEVIKSNVLTLDRRGSSAGVKRNKELADALDKTIVKLSNHDVRIQTTERRSERVNKFLFGGGALTGLGGIFSYFQFFGGK